MNFAALHRRAVAIIAVAVVLTPFFPQPIKAGNTKERVQVKIGKPSVWSLAQAHYLLASMHKKNASISIDPISSSALDPNAPNATRLQILRTVLGIQAEFNQKVGVENQDKLREEQVQLKRRADAQAELAGKQEELRAEKAKLNGLKKQLASLQETDRQREEARKAESDAQSTRNAAGQITEQKFIPLTEEDSNRKSQIVVLQQKVTNQQATVDGLSNEVTTLNGQANAAVTPPSLTDTTLTANTITLPSPSTSLQTLIDKTLSGAGKPSLAASIALDNYVGMQYEIIAKQLTLLRDEIGPDKRVIFVELPSSIYTVPCKSEDYIVQVHWKATDYYRDEELHDPYTDLDYIEHCPDKAQARIKKIKERREGLDRQEEKRWAEQDSQTEMSAPERETQKEKKPYSTPYSHTSLKEMSKKRKAALEQRALELPIEPCTFGWITLKQDDEDNSVRAVDIIPRQSALNVNDFHATVSQKNFMGVLKLLSGLGVKVDYQRQRELYEEFLQQEVFASGFGKGRQDFGWTFGPLPGTNRIAPGQRTTYAVLAVPHDASAIHFEAEAIAYKRTETPTDTVGTTTANSQRIEGGSFDVEVPNEQTEGFDVRSISYTPVQSGSPVTAVLGGISFSPQINIFVENTPLTRVLNFGSKESAELKPGSTDSKIKGFFELVNSKEIMVTFEMGDPAFVGTPNLTFVTPEKTSSINFFPLWVNYRRDAQGNQVLSSLRDTSVAEPMFMPSFSLTTLDVKADPTDDTYLKARLTGAGLRRSAEIWVNDIKIVTKDPDTPPANLGDSWAQQDSTTAYRIRFKKEGGPVWNVRLRQKTVRGFEEGSLTQRFPVPTVSKPFEIRHYLANAGAANAELDIRFFDTVPEGYKKEKNEEIKKVQIKKVEIHSNEGTYPCARYAADRPCGQFEEDEEKYRARFVVFPFAQGSHKADRDTITVTLTKDITKEIIQPDKTKKQVIDRDVKEVLDIPLPVRPQITKVANSETGKPAGFADQEVTVIIQGVNLDAIKKIFFGTQQADIVGVTDNYSAIVKVPKLANLPKGESAVVPITVEMNSDFYEGKTLPVGYYKYIGEPSPLDVGEPVPVIVRSPHRRQTQPPKKSEN